MTIGIRSLLKNVAFNKNKETSNWDLVEAEAGDIIAIDGNTYHRSGHNQTDKIRAMYACVYSTKQMNFKGFHNRRWKFCNCKDGIINRKLPKEENNLWERFKTNINYYSRTMGSY